MKSNMPRNGLPPIHSGEFLREALDELGISQARFAIAIGVSPQTAGGLKPLRRHLHAVPRPANHRIGLDDLAHDVCASTASCHA